MKLRSVTSVLAGRISRNILFWLLYAFYADNSTAHFFPSYLLLLITLFITYGIPGYINNLWLIPNFFLKRKYLAYCGLFIVLLALAAIFSYYGTHFLNSTFPFVNYMGALKNAPVVYHAFPAMLTFVLLVLGKFTGDAVQHSIQLEDLERQRVESELESLRSQVNPHFLFNALNTIYGMARRNHTQTADAVLKLSDILRHSLYECDEKMISLKQEIAFVKQYIEFTQLRLHNKEQLQVSWSVPENKQNIAPLLLVPFIENAIKHGLGKHANNSWVTVDLQLTGNDLLFQCANSNYNGQKNNPPAPQHSGIGLKNVIRRLEILYPGKHELEIKNNGEIYSVQLKISL